MKFIALTITILVALVAAFAASPAETTHACGQLTVYNTVAEYAAQSTNIIDNGDGTVTINRGSPNHERTYTPHLEPRTCPSGGDRPAGRLPQANNGRPPTSTTTYRIQSRPTVARNVVHDVHAVNSGLRVNVNAFFRGEDPRWTTATVEPNEDFDGTITAQMVNGELELRWNVAQPNLRERVEVCTAVGKQYSCTMVYRNVGSLTEAHEAEVTLTARNNAGEVSVTITVTVFVTAPDNPQPSY